MTSVELAFLHLQCSPELVRDVLSKPDKYYRERMVRRRSRSRAPRVVYAISNDLRRVHRAIALGLGPHVQALPHAVQGFRADFSTLTNARVHCNKKVVVTADLHDFFGTITTQNVVALFERLGAPFHVALLLARICTYKGCLPQGGRASPAIANLVAASLDAVLLRAFPRATYTRYVDDLAFSGTDCPDEQQLKDAVMGCGFTIKERSYRHQRTGSGQYVTGLCVEGEVPRVPRGVHRAISRALYFASKYSLEGHLAGMLGRPPTDDEVRRCDLRLRGNICSYGRVEPDLFRVWRCLFNTMLRKPL